MRVASPKTPARVALAFASALLALAAPLRAQTLLLSANDGIETFEDGAYHARAGDAEGSLTALDVSTTRPRVLWSLPSEQTAAGPPSSVALTPDGTLAIVSNAARRDPQAPGKRLDEKALLVYDLSGATPRLSATVALAKRPWGIAIDPSGRRGLVANGDGTVTLLAIAGHDVRVGATVSLGPPTLLTMAAAFTRDGRWALVTRRGDATLTVLRVDDDTLTPVRDIAVGSNPYEVIVSPDGRLAAVSDLGHNTGDRNSVTLVDLRQSPFRAVDVFSVGPTPEGIAFSPDSTRLAVNSIDGSNLPAGHPFHQPGSLIQLFDLSATPVRLLGTAPAGANAQGVAFTGDGRGLVVQDFASDSLLVLGVTPAGLGPLLTRLPMDGAPSGVGLHDVR